MGRARAEKWRKATGRAYNGDRTHLCSVRSSRLHPRWSVTAAVLRLGCAEPNDKGQVLANCDLRLSLIFLVPARTQ